MADCSVHINFALGNFLHIVTHSLSISLLFPTLPRRIQGFTLLSRISECRKGSNPFVSVHPVAFLHDGVMDFLHIEYHNQVPWTADACKIEFGFVSNFSNYHYFS